MLKPFAFTGTIGSTQLAGHIRPDNILRDSGALVSLVLREATPFPDCYTDETIFIEAVGGSSVNGVPVYSVYLTCELVTGYVKLAVLDKLPIRVSLFLGNDLAWDQMRLCPLVSPHPTCQNNIKEKEIEYPSFVQYVLSLAA